MVKFYLYKIVNSVNGKMYIGVTKYPEKRKRQHFQSSSNFTKKHLVRQAINKYGKEFFSFTILCIGCESYIYDLEAKAIATYGTVRGGYNISPGGKGGGGGKIPYRSDDTPIYVSGFWFPDRRTCLSLLNLPPTTLHGWKLSGKVGDECKLKDDSLTGVPIYVGSFWFYDLKEASKALGVHEGTIKSRVKAGKTGQHIGQPGRKRVNVYVEGAVYSSLADAISNSDYTYKMLRKRIKDKNNPNFYIIEEEILNE